MGSCYYYLRASFKSPLTRKQSHNIKSFLIEVSKAEDFWQDNRGTDPSVFWPKFNKLFPDASRYLVSQNINTTNGDCNNNIAGCLEAGWTNQIEDYVNAIQAGQTEVHYSAEVWHLCSWEPLAKWFKKEFGATKATWFSEEDRYILD